MWSCEDSQVAGICNALRGFLKICENLHRFVIRFCKDLQRLGRSCKNLKGFAKTCKVLYGFAWIICKEVHGFVMICKDLGGFAAIWSDL